MPEVCILSTEPLVNIVAPLFYSPTEKMDAENAHINQYQAVDILTGVLCPELGGSPNLLDMYGVNYYYDNQWIAKTGMCLNWANQDSDPRWKSFGELLNEAYLRYRKPVVLTETSHPGENRPEWITYIGRESALAITRGVPLLGICLYPILDRPDWDDVTNWHHSGLWDEVFFDSGERRRHLNMPYANALKKVQENLL